MFDVERVEPGVLPEGLPEMSPGAGLARVLESVDQARLSGFDRVVLLQAWSRQISHDQARFYACLIGVAESTEEALDGGFSGEEVQDSAVMEIRAALSWTRRAAESQLELAHLLYERLPRLWVTLESGWIDLPKARVICDLTLHLEVETAREVADRVLESASRMTTGQLRARLARLVITIDPESAKKRYEQGVEERRVVAEANPDGTANLCGWQLPAVETQAAMRRINDLARAAKSKDDPRNMDLLRADVLLDLLCGRHGHANRGTVDISVDLTTLVELSDNPGELAGYGPLIADVARRVVDEQRDSVHRIQVTDRGEVIWTGITRRRPTTHQQRQIHAQNPTCVFPGCRIPATDCDIDHTKAWAEGGPTDPSNLAPLCRHDHVGKHRGWDLKQTRPGVYTWTSPSGHTYTVGPDPP